MDWKQWNYKENLELIWLKNKNRYDLIKDRNFWNIHSRLMYFWPIWLHQFITCVYLKALKM
jgi:hypothetical protein